MQLESKLLDAYRSARLGGLKRLAGVLSFREDVPLWIGSLLFVLVNGCCENSPISSHSITAVIAGNSMEPTLLGPQRQARCNDCQSTMRFSDAADLDDYPASCPRCGSRMDFTGHQAAQTVNIHPIEWSNASIRRGELAAIENRDRDRLEVKRVVGFPGESIQIVNGDIWIDGQRYQKSISQFATLAIEVDRWSEIESVHTANRNREPIEFCYQSFSLWPRTGEQLKPIPSPILDEYRCNSKESRELVAVRDIGIHLVLSYGEALPANIEICLWYEGAVRRLPLEISATGVRILTTSSPSKVCSIYHELPDSLSLIVAAVDGRLLAGTEHAGQAIDINECVLDSLYTHSNCSATQPISFRMLGGEISISQALIVRDIHYRGGNDETEFAFPPVDGYCLLGDNVSNSSDSRHRWPDGVSARSIVGRVESVIEPSGSHSKE